jgi:hypothetical protein
MGRLVRTMKRAVERVLARRGPDRGGRLD